MRKLYIAILTLVALLTVSSIALVVGVSAMLRVPQDFVAPLDGGEEVPPVDTKAPGLAKFQLGDGGSELSYKLIVANIENVTQAHIQEGRTAQW